MSPDPRKSAIDEHQRWLGHLQPEGLVVSPAALVDSQILPDKSSYARLQDEFSDVLGGDPEDPRLPDFPRFARSFLGWKDELFSLFSVTAEIPDGLRVSTGEHGEILQPDAAYRHFRPADAAQPWLLLVRILPAGTDADALPDARSDRGWIASPHQKFERLLRETGVPIGVLCSEHAIRLVFAPRGENAGWLTFPVAFMATIPGRPALAALHLLLSHQRLITVPESVRLPAILRKSRDYQANVSTELSGQVLEALFELARGFQSADEKSAGRLLSAAWSRNPQEIYGGLITSLLRMVFLLYAEDRGLMPSGELYQRNYSVQGLYDALRADHERYPDTMDDRFAAWPRLLALFRAVSGGCSHRSLSLPARAGHLFDPRRFPFLEGRISPDDPFPDQLPRISDGTLHRVLSLLLYLDGERLSYRTLDVEQIGSVYETIMGFAVEKAPGRMIALKPRKSHGAPVHISLADLLAAKPADREKFLLESADTKLPEKSAKALKSAASEDDLLAALDSRIDRRATPHPVPPGSLVLQPTDERRRSGSHYTPRSFTEPIVRKTLEPILDRLGRHPLPEAILDLKIADIAVGSAAFLVESCRQLADELVSSWHFHKCLPVIPPDEDELLFARRLVAQRCLYGVDRNPMAVDLAKLSLWLATMAKDHPFTFLDHAIKCGDSLVGLTNQQIAAFHWDLSAAKDRVLGQEKLDQQITTIANLRKDILKDTEDSPSAVLRKHSKLSEANAATQSLKTTADLVIAAFFAGSKPKERQHLRDDFLLRHLELQKGENTADNLKWQVDTLKQLCGGEHPIRPFHWEIEFPEVFSRENPGFDGIVGNPPFAGKNTLIGGNRNYYLDWLLASNPESNGNADLVAHFFRKAFRCLGVGGSFGLIATNTIGQGDTREAGLRFICKNGGTIYCANRRTRWPGEAAVVVSVVWVHVGPCDLPPLIDGRRVPQITAFLFHGGGNDTPTKLRSNAGISFTGYYIHGSGFLFSESDAGTSSLEKRAQLLEVQPNYSNRILPYLGGEDFLNVPDQSHRRFVIDLNDFEQPSHTDCTELFEIVHELVKPSRDKLPPTNSNNKKLKKYWWRWMDSEPAFPNFLPAEKRQLFHPNVGSHLSFGFVPLTTVVGKPHNIFALASYGEFAFLQSRVHEAWARFLASSLKDDLRYTPTDCFETFPFPPNWESNTALESAGREYYEFRAALMIRNNEGLTKTYNRFHDPDERSPDLLRLRELHAAMDRAVLDAYGWPDIPTTCQFLLDYEEDEEADPEPTARKGKKKKKPWRYRWPDEVRDEVLARLLALNAERHAEEVRLGIAPGMKPATSSKKKPPRPPESSPEDPDSFALA